MDKVMTIQEIEDRFDDEWVLVANPQTDDALHILSGQVVCHSRDRDEVYQKAIELRPHRFAVFFNGELPADAEFAL